MEDHERKNAPNREAGGAQDHCHKNIIDSPSIAGSGAGGDGEGLLAFVCGWSEDGPWWPTAIPRDGGATETRTFTDLGTFADWVRSLVGDKNLYFHVNDLSPGAKSKGKKADVTRVRGLHVDVDARVPEGGWPTSEPTPARLAEMAAHCAAEHERIRRFVVDGVGWPVNLSRPTAILDSGGGFQCFWRFEDDEQVPPDLAEALNTVIAGLLDGDRPTVDVSRIMRLPGTVNLASQKKRWRGRVDIPTRLVWADWSRRFKVADFPEPATIEAKASPSARASVALPVDLPKADSLDSLPAAVSARTRMLIVNGNDPDDPTRYPSRSEVLFAVLCAMVRAAVADDMIASVVLDPDYGISAHVLEQPRPRQYVERQIQKARDAADGETDQQLIDLNERHALLTHEGSKATVAEFVYELLNAEEKDPVRQRWRWAVYFQSAADFRLTFGNRMASVGKDKNGADVFAPLGDAWLKWRGRREYRGLTFDPGAGEVVGDKRNLWRGFAVDPAPGDWGLMQAHILEVLADGDPEVADYITRWLALAVQRPQQPAGVALVFRGGRGSGKGIFAHAARAMFGQHGFYIPGAAALGAKFNAHFRDTVLLYADEVKWNGNKNAESLLQAIITEPELLIEGKYREAALAKNRLHLIMTSNEDWVVPAGIDERRFAVFRPSDRRQGEKHKQYFDDLGAQMEGGGLAAMLHDLLAMDLTGFNVRGMPESRELSHQKMEGLSGPNRIVMEMLSEGIAPGGMFPRNRSDPVVATAAVGAWAVDRRIVRDAPSSRKMAAALKMMGIERDRFYDAHGEQFWGWGLPTVAEARRAWTEKLGLPGVEWDEADNWTAPPG